MNQRSLALEILNKTIKNEAYSNLLMRKELNKLEPIQRAFVTNLVNGVLRKYEILKYQFKDLIVENTPLRIELILNMAMYERFYLKEADYVVNNEYVSLGKNKYDKAFINAILRKVQEFKDCEIAYIKYCLPAWLYNLLDSQYDEASLLKIFDVYQNIPKIYYRVNKKKCKTKDLTFNDIQVLNEDIFTSERNLLHTKAYELGYFYVQDYNSASLYQHLDLKKGLTLLDVCAAPGSKLFNCLDVLDPKDCYCNDLYEHRIDLIKKMAKKLGYDGLNYLNYDGLKLKEHLNMRFDRIMLDAPCSGLGVIGRKPDLKFHVSPTSLDELQNLQLNLLEAVKDLLKDDGLILYSTCTLNKKENERLIKKFLASNVNFELEEEKTIINNLGDCFYYAKLRKSTI